MIGASQGTIAGETLTVYDGDDKVIGTDTFAAHPTGATDQDYVLVAMPGAETLFGITADLTLTSEIDWQGGKICFGASNIDCVAWGDYVGPTTNTGTNFNNPFGGLRPSTSIVRDISGGSSATQLDAADDTNDSNADFSESASNPQNFAGTRL